MKLLYILLLAPGLAFGQKTVTISDFEFENDTCFQGDSVWITFKCVGLSPTTDSVEFSIQHIYPDLSVGGLTVVYKKKFFFVAQLPTEPDGSYKDKVKIPNSYTVGDSEILPTKFATANRPDFYIKPKVIGGIFYPLPENEGEIKYFNTQGIEIKKPTEGLYIWKTERSSGKVMLLGN